MTTDALINGNIIELNSEEKEKAEKFHRERIAFVILDNKLVVNDNPDDDRDHQHWLTEDFKITIKEFERLTRGYIKPGRIQLFIGSKFECINPDTLRLDHLLDLICLHNKKFGNNDIQVFNGVHIGKVGDIWEPIQRLMYLKQDV